MASTNEKPKKGLMTLYKAAIASPRHRFHVHESKPSVINNNIDHHHKVETKSYNISRNWLLMRKQKVVVDQHGGDAKDVAGENCGDIVNNSNVRGGEVIAIEGRKSVSHVETNLGSVISFLQVKVLVSDMPNYMQVHAFRCARRTHDSLDKFSAKHMAYNIKKEFDKVHGPAWHCIVGSSFGSFVTHSTGCFLYFSMEKLYILLFKTKIQKVKD